MSATQYLPIPPQMLALACETVTRRVSRLPFLRSGVMVTELLIGVTLECLNAESTRALPLTTPRDMYDRCIEGLDRIIEQRLKIAAKTVVPVLADVLTSAGITEPAEILDRNLHRPRKSLRLLPPWTWHIASALPYQAYRESIGHDETSSPAWMSTCPICRTGILNKIIGKQLFGIPRTDYFIECSHCGAKFIPVGSAFRLVSIATVRDPLWKKHLDKTFSAEEWAALARGTGQSKKPLPPGHENKNKGPVGVIPPGHLALMKDGTLPVPLEGKTLYFKPAGINISGGIREGMFSRMQTTLEELLADPLFSHLREPVNAQYSRYLPLKAGLFLSQLKERHDTFYREFLNPYGDEKFGMIRAEESGEIGKAGVLLVVVNHTIYYSCICPVSFRVTINETFGRITPGLCYLNGDAMRCRINAVLCANQKEAGLFIHASNRPEEQEQIIRLLNGQDSTNVLIKRP